MVPKNLTRPDSRGEADQRIIAFDACDPPLACNVCRQSIQVVAPGRRAGTTLGRVDGFDQDESECESHEGVVVLRGFLAS